MKRLIFFASLIFSLSPAVAHVETKCEGEALIHSGEVLSVEYIDHLGCKAQVGHLEDVEANLNCSLFDVEIEAKGVILEPPSDNGCTYKPGDKFKGYAERHGLYIYMFNPEEK